MENKICKGCGEVLQTTNPNKPGYIKESLLDREELYCQRCFKLAHYGTFEHIDIDQEQFNTLFSLLNKEDLVIYVLDIFNLYGSYIEDLKDKIKDTPCLIVVNKIDVLPKSLKHKKILDYVKNFLIDSKLNILDTILVSSKKKFNVDSIINYLKKKHFKKAYIIGKSNSGKSTLVDALTKSLGLETSKLVSSYYPGTTLKTIKVPLDFMDLYDTPGLESNNSIYDYLNLKNLKKVVPLQEIKPISMSIYPNTSLFIGSSAKIDFKIKEKINVIFYGSSLIKYHSTKLEDSNEKFNKLIDEKILVPKLENNPKIEEFKVTSFDIKEDRISLVINGLCIIDLLRVDGHIDVYTLNEIGVSNHKSMFGGVNNVNK